MDWESELKEFQVRHRLKPDGQVGPMTWMELKKSIWFPSRPAFHALTPEESVRFFGNPAEGSTINPDGSFIPNHEWFETALKPVRVDFHGSVLPELIVMHRMVERPFRELLFGLLRAGVDQKIISWGGMWNPRVTRRPGSKRLSQHAYGVAFDINHNANPMGQKPLDAGLIGSVLEIVPIAQSLGWFWGGWFDDPMHFEWCGP
jgi:hypothetical protein